MSQDLTIEKFEITPARIDAAMRFIEHCMWLTDPLNLCGIGGGGRPLHPAEQAAYNAALEAMRLYFVGEMDFGGAPVRRPEKPEKARDAKLCKTCKQAPRENE